MSDERLAEGLRRAEQTLAEEERSRRPLRPDGSFWWVKREGRWEVAQWQQLSPRLGVFLLCGHAASWVEERFEQVGAQVVTPHRPESA